MTTVEAAIILTKYIHGEGGVAERSQYDIISTYTKCYEAIQKCVNEYGHNDHREEESLPRMVL